MDSAFSTAIPNPSLAAIAQLSENSRLGFASRNTTLHQGIEWSKSTLALGLPEWSGKTASDPVEAANNGLVKAAQKVCSAYPDVTQVGAGADWGAYPTGGAQVTLNANGNSGELSLSWAWVINSGFVGPDAYLLGGVVRNAPTNQSLNGPSASGNFAVQKTGISANSNNIQGTFGPSVLPATASGQVSANLSLVTVPYAGYVMNEVKCVCTALFGRQK